MKTMIYIGIIQRNYHNEPSISITQTDMTNYYQNSDDVILYRFLEEREIDVPDLPGRDEITRMKIDGLEGYCERVKAEARAKVRQIEEQIANLRCLEHTESGEFDDYR